MDDVGADGEGLLFVWKGAIRVKDGATSYAAGERDTVFIKGAKHLEVIGDAPQGTEVIQVVAPPPPGL